MRTHDEAILRQRSACWVPGANTYAGWYPWFSGQYTADAVFDAFDIRDLIASRLAEALFGWLP